ncbi:MAG TPA: amino acid adenylation domain-containing protein [Blastocatellia bacterium]|nr:amino acid adenylation domain-containing protein [Blastocatellia bacterium]
MPLDPSYPRERLRFMLEDAEVSVLLAQERLIGSLPHHKAEVVSLDSDWDKIARQSSENPSGDIEAENTAYVVYTSGSTGAPKGIPIPHRAVARLVLNTNYVKLSYSDRIAQASNASFDAATFEIWGALLNGARLVGIAREVTLSPRRFAGQIQEQEISVLFLTTALFNQIARTIPSAFSSVRVLLFGGEAAEPKLVREVLRAGPPRRLIHVYGPTESTTFTSWYQVRDVPEGAATIPIGRPLSNTQIYLLDRNMQPVPVGVPGELYIGGDGLARGYHNQPELTSERFVANPFSTNGGTRLYKTDDLACYLPDGEIKFLGRADFQVKVRGFRVELGEVEAVLGEHAGVREAVIAAREGAGGDRYLAAYVVAEQGHSLTTKELRDFLKLRLPNYMVPSTFMILDALPLNHNGKVDRRALQVLDQKRPERGSPIAPPGSPLEHLLTQIWEEVLGVQPVGIRDDFFELGGHSLLAIRMLRKVEQICGKELPVTALFAEATIEHLAKACLEHKNEAYQPSLVEVQSGGSQRPFFFLHGDYNSGGIYCVNLARHLSPDQPFYVLPSHGLDGRTPPSTIEAMADQHLKTLRGFQPEGPYLLGGFCHGGLAAFEMARRLHEEGQRVELLVLIHASAQNVRYKLFREMIRCVSRLFAFGPEKELDWFLRLRDFIIRSGEMSQFERIIFTLKKAKKIKNLAGLPFIDGRGGPPPGVSSGQDLIDERPEYGSLHSGEIDLRYRRAMEGYVPRAYPGPVTLFWPSEEPLRYVDDPTAGWSRVAAEVAVHSIPGEHLTCITRHLPALAEQLEICLQKIQANQVSE